MLSGPMYSSYWNLSMLPGELPKRRLPSIDLHRHRDVGADDSALHNAAVILRPDDIIAVCPGRKPPFWPLSALRTHKKAP